MTLVIIPPCHTSEVILILLETSLYTGFSYLAKSGDYVWSQGWTFNYTLIAIGLVIGEEEAVADGGTR